MNRFLLCLCVILISGCHNATPQKVVARIGNYCITKQEFNEAYNNSIHASSNSLQAREAFLNNMINQKLILLDAQARGLDKNKEFLKMIEDFWQQSLLTMALKEKSKEGTNLDQWVASLRETSKVKIYEENVR